MRVDGVGSPVRLRTGWHDGTHGVYWAWPVDGYFDLHHAADGEALDGSEPVAECLPTLAEARREAREEDRWHRTVGRMLR